MTRPIGIGLKTGRQLIIIIPEERYGVARAKREGLKRVCAQSLASFPGVPSLAFKVTMYLDRSPRFEEREQLERGSKSEARGT